MADTDRRSYGTGAEPPLTLGGRGASRSRRPAPVTLILSLLVLAVAAAGVFWLYRSGTRSSGDAPQPVGAPLRDVRVAAPPQSQAPDAAAGLSIYKDSPTAPPSPTFAPAPEEPTPRPTESAAAPAATPPRAVAPAATATIAHDRTSASPDSDRKAPAEVAAGDPLGALIDRSTKVPGKAAAKPVDKPVKLAEATGGTEIQIGAFSSEAQADQGWNAAAAAAPGPLAGKGKRVVPLDHDGGLLYRTFITGFASREAAQAACDRLKAAGRTCFVR